MVDGVHPGGWGGGSPWWVGWWCTLVGVVVVHHSEWCSPLWWVVFTMVGGVVVYLGGWVVLTMAGWGGEPVRVHEASLRMLHLLF